MHVVYSFCTFLKSNSMRRGKEIWLSSSLILPSDSPLRSLEGAVVFVSLYHFWLECSFAPISCPTCVGEVFWLALLAFALLREFDGCVIGTLQFCRFCYSRAGFQIEQYSVGLGQPFLRRHGVPLFLGLNEIGVSL